MGVPPYGLSIRLSINLPAVEFPDEQQAQDGQKVGNYIRDGDRSHGRCLLVNSNLLDWDSPQRPIGKS